MVPNLPNASLTATVARSLGSDTSDPQTQVPPHGHAAPDAAAEGSLPATGANAGAAAAAMPVIPVVPVPAAAAGTTAGAVSTVGAVALGADPAGLGQLAPVPATARRVGWSLQNWRRLRASNPEIL